MHALLKTDLNPVPIVTPLANRCSPANSHNILHARVKGKMVTMHSAIKCEQTIETVMPSIRLTRRASIGQKTAEQKLPRRAGGKRNLEFQQRENNHRDFPEPRNLYRSAGNETAATDRDGDAWIFTRSPAVHALSTARRSTSPARGEESSKMNFTSIAIRAGFFIRRLLRGV